MSEDLIRILLDAKSALLEERERLVRRIADIDNALSNGIEPTEPPTRPRGRHAKNSIPWSRQIVQLCKESPRTAGELQRLLPGADVSRVASLAHSLTERGVLHRTGSPGSYVYSAAKDAFIPRAAETFKNHATLVTAISNALAERPMTWLELRARFGLEDEAALLQILWHMRRRGEVMRTGSRGTYVYSSAPKS